MHFSLRLSLSLVCETGGEKLVKSERISDTIITAAVCVIYVNLTTKDS